MMKKKWTRDEAIAFFRRAVDDKKALCECIRNGACQPLINTLRMPMATRLFLMLV